MTALERLAEALRSEGGLLAATVSDDGAVPEPHGDAVADRGEAYPLLVEAGFAAVHVSPRMIHVDASRPELAEGFTRRTFTAMIAGVREAALAAGLTTAATFDDGLQALHRTTEADGMFGYTFFKATATMGS